MTALKKHDRFLGGAIDEEEHFSEGLQNNDECLDALATAQEDEAEALASLARDKQHQVRGYFSSTIVTARS